MSEKRPGNCSQTNGYTVGWYPSVYSMSRSRCIQKGNAARNSARRGQYRRSTEVATRQHAFVFHAKQVDIAVDVSPGRSARSRAQRYTRNFDCSLFIPSISLPICSMVKQLSVSMYELAISEKLTGIFYRSRFEKR